MNRYQRSANIIPQRLLALLMLPLALIACGDACADVAVIVNPANKAELDDSAIARIYLAQVRTFPGGGEALPVDQKEGGATQNEFSDKLLKKAPAHIKSFWAQQKFTGNAKALKQLSDDEAVLKFVAENPSAIGYVEASKVRASVKVVAKY